MIKDDKLDSIVYERKQSRHCYCIVLVLRLGKPIKHFSLHDQSPVGFLEAGHTEYEAGELTISLSHSSQI